jgi:dTDP-glucose 4,6-dehydratase
VRETVEKYQITHVIHFAAQSHVQNSFEDSIKFTHDNILGTHTLLEVCRRYGKIEKFIHVSTDEVYGESMNHIEEKHKTEHSILCPTNPYAATKAAAELIAKSYFHSFKMPIIITRGNNVYGPNQYPEKVIPLFIKLLKENKPITIQGDGSNVRSFLHVKDVSKALQLILDKGVIGEIYNIGSGDRRTNISVAKMILSLLEKPESLIEYVKDRKGHDLRYSLDSSKIKKQFGWAPSINFEEGISALLNLELSKLTDLKLQD